MPTTMPGVETDLPPIKLRNVPRENLHDALTLLMHYEKHFPRRVGYWKGTALADGTGLYYFYRTKTALVCMKLSEELPD